mmetsp:Transcript_36040/g.71324  ORF Transcript_36040/g.71324 Transcript_36040/m.71324 type:complete len:270 (+) Transcript_36040:643-1452(+)
MGKTAIFLVLLANAATVVASNGCKCKACNDCVTIRIGVHTIWRHPAALVAELWAVLPEGVKDADGQGDVCCTADLLQRLYQPSDDPTVHAINVVTFVKGVNGRRRHHIHLRSRRNVLQEFDHVRIIPKKISVYIGFFGIVGAELSNDNVRLQVSDLFKNHFVFPIWSVAVLQNRCSRHSEILHTIIMAKEFPELCGIGPCGCSAGEDPHISLRNAGTNAENFCAVVLRCASCTWHPRSHELGQCQRIARPSTGAAAKQRQERQSSCCHR